MSGTLPPDEQRVLAVVLSAAAGDPGGEIDVRPIMPRLDMPRRTVYAAVLALTDAGLLEYRGAGPRVRLTPEGRAHLPG